MKKKSVMKNVLKVLKSPFDLLLKVEEKITYTGYKRQKNKNKKIARKLKTVSGKEYVQKEKIQKLQSELENKAAQVKNLTEEMGKLKKRLNSLEEENIFLKQRIESMEDGGNG